MRKIGLYIHIPFCKRKCEYCDFYSVCDITAEGVDAYIDALCLHIKKEAHVYENGVFDTVFIGGGTPSILSPEQINRLVCCIKGELNVAPDAEITFEANPSSLDRVKLLAMKKAGVNRLSIGMQSANNGELCTLGRLHSYEAFEQAYQLARECGFNNISVDVMYGLPMQKKEDLLKTLDQVCEIAPEHISAYCLKIEENTPFGKRKDTLALPSDEEEYEMYIALCSFLGDKGYKQYEISNFAKEGYTSRHNIKYWQSEEYAGFGPGAHSYINGERYSYKRDIRKYIAQCSSCVPSKIFESSQEKEKEATTSKLDKMDEYVMLKLRLCHGVCEEEFSSLFSLSFIEEYPRVRDFVKSGHMKYENKRYFFTPQGFFVSNYIYTEILHF